MRKIYFTLFGAMIMGSAAVSATETQPANSDFETWVDCVPWTSSNNTTKVGQTPEGWCVSNVYASVIVSIKAETGEKLADGYEGAAARLKNVNQSSNNIPGYMTLGTTWSTSKGFGSNKDGGVWGGISFTERPAGIEFMYRRPAATAADKSEVVAYLWKGQTSQASVPGVVSISSPKTCTMVNRDRNILGMTTDQGGAVTKSDDFELIATLDHSITDTPDDWTKVYIPFDYKSESTPEMLNVIISAGDYFGGQSTVQDGKHIDVDNFRLVYAAAEDPKTETYNGYLTINMAGQEISKNQEASIEITTTGENTVTFKLPDFKLVAEGEDLPIGDIVVENVKTSTVDGVTNYEGSCKDLALLGGMIMADVNLKGTTDYMLIDVIWTNDGSENGTPINVIYSSKPLTTTAISAIEAEAGDAPAEYYNIQGMRVNADTLTPGLYIRRQGNKATKVMVF